MQKPDIERRAAELHECCRMPMEQARELAASEANPDWYARGQDWGLADALTAGQDGDWTLDDIARAFAAGVEAKTTMKVEISADPEMLRRAMAAETEAAMLRVALDQKHAEYEDLQRHGNNTARNLARMQAALEANASRSADYLRRAIKAEARCAECQDCHGATARETAVAQTEPAADTRKPCTCDGAGRGPGRACVVKAGGRLGDLWRCSEGCNGCDDCTDYEA